MIKNFLAPLFVTLTLVACNNSADVSATSTDTAAAAGHDTMHMASATAVVPELPSIPEGAKVIFQNLKDGAVVSSPLKVKMGTEVIKVDTAGPVIAGIGHHHLLIDAEDSLTAGTMVPKDSTHLHFGKGQTETEIKLTPGKHKLALQFADGLHRSYGGKLSTVITVNVK
jgi:hypothetical protein